MREYREAEDRLLAVLADLEKGHQSFYVFGILMHLARLYIESGDRERAKERLTRALGLGKKEGLKAAEAMTPDGWRVVLCHAQEWSLEPEYVRWLQGIWGVEDASTWPCLTQRELEVLKALGRGYSFTKISSTLGISLHTVTTHIKHIYRKLDVRSRAEAVYVATQRGILKGI
jgi:ATP/maltotriose-dependent transcriptional regulator MalT